MDFFGKAGDDLLRKMREATSEPGTAPAPTSAAPVPAGRRGRCKHCGKTVSVGTSPCPHCGHELKWSKPAASGASPASALHSYLAEQARNKPVKEIKPVSKTWFWCLAVVPWVGSMVASIVATVMGNENPHLISLLFFVVSTLVFLALDQHAIKKSGRNGDGMLWYFLFVLVGTVGVFLLSWIAIIVEFAMGTIYLFTSGKDTKRGKTPGFVSLAFLAANVALVLLALFGLGASQAETANNLAIADTAKYVFNEQLLPRLTENGTCSSVKDMTLIGKNKWSATASVLSNGQFEDVPILITLREDNFVLVEIDLVKLRAGR